MTKILFLLTAATMSVPTFAQQGAPQQVQIVLYSDLDLTADAGQRALDRRIRSAVEIVCGATSDSDPAGKNDVIRCRRENLAKASLQARTAFARAMRKVTIAASVK